VTETVTVASARQEWTRQDLLVLGGLAAIAVLAVALGFAGATRIQASFIRASLMSGGPATVTSSAGHAIVGYTN